ncbi:MAG: hypothetical protein NT032_06415 [Actinobacteria bacterium]|nr:hypothetical protein [Actinomycetota bacterium]
MGSGVVLAVIVGIWAIFLLPVLLRKHDATGKLQDVDKFREAMGQLGSTLNIPQQPKNPKIEVKREIRAGHPDPQISLQVRKRRKVFLAITTSIPIFIFGIVFGYLSIFFAVVPVAMFVGYLTWVRMTIKPRVAEVIDENAPHQKYVHRRDRNHRFAALAQLRKAAAKRLTEVEAELDTSKTSSWQTARPLLGAEFETPKTVLPSFVDSPAATEVPRVLDRESGGWNADAMIQAAARQRREELAKLVADDVDEVIFSPVEDEDGTNELPRVIGA